MIPNKLAEKRIAQEMQDKLYNYVLIFPDNDYRLPLYFKSIQQASETVRTDYPDLKPVTIKHITDFIFNDLSIGHDTF